MTTETAVSWSIEADYLQACNCDYGCPCEFEADPTQGFCDGTGIYRITEGSYGEVDLSGLGFGFVAHWPGPLYEGGGTAVFLIDERASEEQREALLTIGSGEAGGLPFEIIAEIIDEVLEPRFVPFEFHWDGKNSSGRLGEELRIALEPIRNPVTGEEEGIQIEHDTGFIFKKAQAVSNKECRAQVDGLDFDYPDKAGFVSQVHYSN